MVHVHTAARSYASRFAVLGDGVADGRGDRTPGYQDIGWADRVAATLARRRPNPADFAYCNVARSDLLTAEVRATQLAPVLSFRPDLVLVVAGSNDIIRGDFERCDDVLADYDAIVTALQEVGAEVVTATIFDVTRSTRVPDNRKAALRRRLDQLAGWIRLVARARRTVHLDLARHPAAAEADVYGADIRVATRRGHAIAAAALVRRLGEHLGSQPRGGHLPA
jgi:lysophospholipase L1-like esterase